jgi:PAS domain S-box-containing protein
MIRMPRATTLRQQILRLLLLASLVAAAIVASAVLFYEQTTFEPRAVASLRQQAASLAAIALPSLETSDAATATQYLATRRNYPDIVAVRLYNNSGERVADYTRGADDEVRLADRPQPDGYEFVDDRLHLWQTVESHGRTAGHLFMCADVPPLYARLPQYGIMAGAVMLALLAVAVILTRGLRRNFLEPVEQLTAVTEQVTQRRDYGLRAPVQHADELGRLAIGLNEMLATVESRDQSLRHSEARMRSIIETEPECVKVISVEGALVEINPAGLVMLEAASLAEARQQPLLQYVAEEHRDAFRSMHRRVIQGEHGALEFEAVGLRGARRWLDTRAVPLRNPDGSIAGALAITRDVTDRKIFERTLARRSEQQAVVVHLGLDAFAANDLDWLFQRACDAVAVAMQADFSSVFQALPGGVAAKMRAGTGWEPGLVSQFEIPIGPDSAAGAALLNEASVRVDDIANDSRFTKRLLHTRFGVASTLAVAIRGSGKPWGLLAAHSKQRYAFTNDDMNVLQEVANLLGQAIQRVSADAARLAIEAQLLQSQKMDALGRLAGGIAHDFNNLLSAILGNAQLAREDVGPTHASVVSLEQIENAGRRAKELVQRILTFSRQQTPHRELLSLQPVVDEVARLLRATIPAGVEVQVVVEPETPMVMADSAQIHQTLLNLGTNAWQAIGGLGGRIELVLQTCEADAELLHVHPSLLPGRYVRITVRDTGIGIDAELQKRIFDPFFTTKPLGEGTGLGLSVVLGIMQSHGGAVTVASEPSRGASFSLYFPAANLRDSTIGEDTAEPNKSGGQGERILYIDDEEPLVFLATRLLERAGYLVAGYTKPDEAVAAFKTDPAAFSLIITDLSMPGMSGMEVARQILSVRADAVVVLASGYLRQADVDAALALGIREVVLKPNTVDELAPIVKRLLRGGGESEVRAYASSV